MLIINLKAFQITNGLEFVIPLQFHPKAPEYPELEDLNPDMWRHEFMSSKKHSFRPRNPLTGKVADFNMNSFMTKIMGLRSDVSMYLGTSTTPPCNGNFIV
jgi:hypothetical protein